MCLKLVGRLGKQWAWMGQGYQGALKDNNFAEFLVLCKNVCVV